MLGGYEVLTCGAKKKTGLDPVTFAVSMEQAGAGEILLTAIDQDGTMNGYDLKLIKSVTDSVSIPVVACGGAGEISHFTQAVNEAGASAVATGSMVVYQGKNRSVLINFPLPDEISAALDRSI